MSYSSQKQNYSKFKNYQSNNINNVYDSFVNENCDKNTHSNNYDSFRN
jgi:hypothetical protein